MPRYTSIALVTLSLAALLALAGSAGAAVDDSYTKSLLHLNGADGSTTFADEAGKVWTPHNSMPIKTDHYKFGGASAFFVGGGAWVDTPNSADFEPGAGPFTIDFWIYPLAYEGSIGHLAGKSNESTSEGYAIWLQNQKIQVSGVNGQGFNIISDDSATPDAWHHIALSSTADTVYLFIDGVQKGSCPRNNIPPHNSTYLLLGKTYNGYIDEFRFSKGVARWTADFTPPPQPYGSGGTVNLAYLHGVASANAVYESFVPSRAIDGDWATYWVAPAHGTPTNPLWVQVDLQKKYLVDQIVLVDPHGALTPSHFYNLYTSVDGVNWNLIDSGTFPDDQGGYSRTVSLTPKQITRYAKYEVVGGQDWASFSEMELWGGPNAVTNVPQNSMLLLLE